MGKIKFFKTYDIIKKEKNEGYIIYYTSKTRIKKFFAFFPVYKNKFKWLTKVEIVEQLILKFERKHNLKYPNDICYKTPKEFWIIKEII
jgi:hypothetical protein